MARSFRIRLNKTPWYPGTYHEEVFGRPFTISNSDGSHTIREFYMEDYHGRPVTNSSLKMDKADRSMYQPINGTHTQGTNFCICDNYIPQYIKTVNDTHWPDPSIPSASSQMTTLLARTNPSRPDISPLDLLQDLKDIPKQLRDVGKLIKSPKKILNSKEIASQYLGTKFGWLPLIQDVKDLLDLGKHIHRRNDELHRLYSDKGLKRRLNLGEWTVTNSSNVNIDSGTLTQLTARISFNTIRRRWGTVRWLPDVLPRFRPSDAEILQQAKKVSLGLTTEGLYQGAWDLLPWTWIVDWFTNVSEYAQTYSNTVPATSADASVMTETFTQQDFKALTLASGLSGGNGTLLFHSKERYVGAGTISAHLPFIGVDRLSILSALFVQRFK